MLRYYFLYYLTTIVEAIYTDFFLLAVLAPLPSIFSALLEDSKQLSFQRGFARYFLAILSTCADSRSNVRFKVILSTYATGPNFYEYLHKELKHRVFIGDLKYLRN